MPRRALLLLALALLVAVGLGVFLADPLGLGGGGDFDPTDVDAASGSRSALEGAGQLAGREGAGRATDPRWIDGDPVGVLTLKLGSASLEGTVTGDGQPLAQATIRVALSPRSLRAAVRTRSDGTWRIDGLPAGSFDVRAGHPGWQGRTVATPAVGAHQVEKLGEIDLARARPPTAEIRIRATDALGRPIPGARVLATTMIWAADLGGGPDVFGVPDVISKRARTDERGEATLGPLPAETYDVAALAPGFQSSVQPSVQLGDGQHRLLVFRMQTGLSISGTVTDRDGNALEGSTIGGMHLGTFTMAPPVRTAADGTFVLDGLREGSYMLFAHNDEYGELQAPGIRAPSTGHRLKLPGTGHIDLRVQRADGSPLTSYRVRPYKTTPYGYAYSQSIAVEDPEGHLRLPLPGGNYHLAVQAANGDYDDETTAAVEIGATTEVVVKLPATASVSGVITDEEGHHVAGAEIYVKHGGFPTGPTREQYARSDADGAFRVPGLPMERIKLHVSHADYADRIVDVDPTVDGTGSEVTIRLGKGATLEGHITRGGTPVEGEQVNLSYGAQWWDVVTTRTDASGVYRFDGVAPRTYKVTTGVFEFGGKGAAKEGVVIGDAGTVTVDLDLGGEGGPGVVEGVVLRASRPVPGAEVTLIDARGWDQSVTVLTDENGRFRAEGLVAGPATVYVESGDTMSTRTTADIPADGKPVEVEVHFGAGSLAGRFVTSSGEPVSGAWLHVERLATRDAEGAQSRRQALCDMDGRFDAQGLEDGYYRIRVNGGDHAGMLTPVFEIQGGAALDVGTFELETGVTLQGRVTDDAGTPIENAAITLEDEAGRSLYRFSLVTTGSDGRYQMTGLAPGHYVVGFEARGYAPSSTPLDLGAKGGQADGIVARGGRIEVRVSGPDGVGLAGVHVSLLDAAGQPVRRTLSLVNLEDPSVGRTDPTGRVVLADLAPGSYTVRAALPGHTGPDPAPTARVLSGQTVSLSVPLAPGS